MIGEWIILNEWFAFSAAMAGALWGVTLQPDYGKVSLGAKAWRFFLSVIAAIFTGPFILYSFLGDAHPSAAAFCMFLVSMLSLAMGPIVIQRVTEWAKKVRISIRNGP